MLILSITSLLVAVLGPIGVLAYKSYNEQAGGKLVATVICIVGLTAFVLSNSFSVIPTGNTGVKTTFGQIDKDTLNPGFSWKIPFAQSIELVNNKQQDAIFSNEDEKIWSETASRTSISFYEITVTYQINPEKSSWIYANVSNYEDNLINSGLITSAIKSSTKTLNDTDVTNRNILEPLVKESLQNAVNDKFGSNVVNINKVVIGQADFDSSYNEALAAKQQAQLEYEKQQTENKKNLEKAESEAKVKLTQAQADADAKKISAEAEAKANEVLSKSITDKVLLNKLYSKWNGELSKVSGSNEQFIIDPSSFLKDNSDSNK